MFCIGKIHKIPSEAVERSIWRNKSWWIHIKCSWFDCWWCSWNILYLPRHISMCDKETSRFRSNCIGVGCFTCASPFIWRKWCLSNDRCKARILASIHRKAMHTLCESSTGILQRSRTFPTKLRFTSVPASHNHSHWCTSAIKENTESKWWWNWTDFWTLLLTSQTAVWSTQKQIHRP